MRKLFSFAILFAAVAMMANGQAQINGITGQITGVVVPGSPTTYSAVQTFPGGDLFAGGVNIQSGTTYTFVAADENKLVVFTSATAVAVTLPQATTTGFTQGAVFHFYVRGAGTVTVTPTTSTLNAAASVAASTGQGGMIESDGTNYSAWISAAASGSGANQALSNLAAVSINSPLLAQAAVDLGSTAAPFRNLYIYGSSGTFGSDSAELTGTFTANRVWTFPDVSDTVVGAAATQTLTQKSIAGSEINSGTVPMAQLHLVNAVASSATPTFNLALGDMQTFTATANVTSITISNIAIGVYYFHLCENGTGGYTWASWPAAVHGSFAPSATASKCSDWALYSTDGTNLYGLGLGITGQ